MYIHLEEGHLTADPLLAILSSRLLICEDWPVTVPCSGSIIQVQQWFPNDSKFLIKWRGEGESGPTWLSGSVAAAAGCTLRLLRASRVVFFFFNWTSCITWCVSGKEVSQSEMRFVFKKTFFHEVWELHWTMGREIQI